MLSKRSMEAAPSVGTIQYTGILADYRAYLMPVRPFTLAFRALHYGRYGIRVQQGAFIKNCALAIIQVVAAIAYHSRYA